MKAELVGSISCPICGKDIPHSHVREEIQEWVNCRIANWGYKSLIFAGTDTPQEFREKRINQLLDIITEEKDSIEIFPRVFSSASFYEAPLLEECIEAIELLIDKRGRPMESDDVKFARTWAAMQEPPIVVVPFHELFNFGLRTTDFGFPYVKGQLTEELAWKVLAKILARFRHSLEPAILKSKGLS